MQCSSGKSGCHLTRTTHPNTNADVGPKWQLAGQFAQAHLKTAQEWLEECNKDLMAYESPQIERPARLRPTNHRIQCSGARGHRTNPGVLFSSLGGSAPSLIHGGASIDMTLSGTSHRCSIRLGFVQFGQVRLSSSSHSQGHSWAVVPLCWGTLSCWVWPQPWGGVHSATVFEWVVHVKWHPPEYQDPRFSRRALHCKKMIHVIHFTCSLNVLTDWSMPTNITA